MTTDQVSYVDDVQQDPFRTMMTRMAMGELALPRDRDWNKARPLTALLESVVDGAGRKAVIDVDSISMRISKFANAGVRVEAGARGSFGPATLAVP